MAVDAGGAWLVGTPRVGAASNGAGDVLAALFLGPTLRGEDTAQALARAVSSVHAVLVATAASGGSELALVEAQDAIVAPPIIFPAERVA